MIFRLAFIWFLLPCCDITCILSVSKILLHHDYRLCSVFSYDSHYSRTIFFYITITFHISCLAVKMRLFYIQSGLAKLTWTHLVFDEDMTPIQRCDFVP